MSYQNGAARQQVTRDLPPVSAAETRRLLTDVLRSVSRAFYLTLKVLPTGLREPVSLAYLLGRAADTISDTRVLPPSERLSHLLTFREQVEGPVSADALREIGQSLTDKQASPGERELLRSLPAAFSVFDGLPEFDRRRVRSVVLTLTRGMEMDLTTFPHEISGEIVALRDMDELDEYTFLVAGCVGEFWTAAAMNHMTSLNRWDEERMSQLGVRFGKALQLTNVLRDLPKDLRMGRCYLPQSELDRVGLAPRDLLDVSSGPTARPVLVKGIELALEHYRAAEVYLIATPRRSPRLRLASLWPILIGLGTLERLALNDRWLDPDRPSKVSRNWVYGMMALSLAGGHSNGGLRAWIGRLRRRVLCAL